VGLRVSCSWRVLTLVLETGHQSIEACQFSQNMMSALCPALSCFMFQGAAIYSGWQQNRRMQRYSQHWLSDCGLCPRTCIGNFTICDWNWKILPKVTSKLLASAFLSTKDQSIMLHSEVGSHSGIFLIHIFNEITKKIPLIWEIPKLDYCRLLVRRNWNFVHPEDEIHRFHRPSGRNLISSRQ